ncbi:AEC family transporter [soil metagenome]
MPNLLIIFISLGLGLVLRRTGWFGPDAHIALNQFVLGVSLPALSLLYLPEMDLSLASLGPICTAWIVFVLAWVVFGIAGKWMGFDRGTVGCIILCCGLFNSSFIGFPVITALYGEEGLRHALLIDQPGSFLVLSTLGIWVAVWYSSGKPSASAMVQKLFTFPPMLAFVAALALKAMDFHHTELTTAILKPLGQTITPVALVSVGLQLRFGKLDGLGKPLSIGLGYKLLLAPVAILVIWVSIAGATALDGLPAQVSIMEAAMAPMITGSILAAQHGLNPRLANLFIGAGIPISFATLAIWYWILNM